MEVFTIDKKDINGRLDCFYYRPDFIDLEKRVANKASKTLGDYIIRIAGGATPRIEDSDKYYTDNPNIGMPFLRVQNVLPEGLKLDDVKYVTSFTHNNLLKRSQVSENNLITKITGVGRMAISSVAPKGFKGNINQHLVVIKTKDYNTSKVIATFLNTDIGEKLAKRRSTGGTRPALDYQSLKNIPIIYKPEIVKIMDDAYNLKKQKEIEAHQILNSINDYVIDELGITLPKLKSKMCFAVNSKETKGKRIDPKGYSVISRGILKAIKKAKYSQKLLSNLIEKSISGEWGEDVEKVKDSENYVLVKVLRNTNFCNQGNLDFSKVAQRMIYKEKYEKVRLKNGDILIEKSGGSPIQPVGRVAIIEDVKTDFAFSNFLQVIRINKQECLPEYLFCFLKTLYNLNYMEYIQNQTTGIKNLIIEEFLSIPVSLPPMNKQREITREYKTKLITAEHLKLEAKNILEKAKLNVERIILGVEEI